MVARPRRWSRVVGYALFAAAGVGAAIVPSERVEDATGPLVYLWAAFLILGGVLAALGSWTDRWIGEYTGLPLLCVALAAYAAVIIASGRPAAVVGGLFLAGVAAVLWARARDVGLLQEEAARAAKQRHEEA